MGILVIILHCDMERGPASFCPDGEASDISVRWAEWLEEFEAFADSKGLFNIAGADAAQQNMRAQRKALLLYHAGARVREIARPFDATDRHAYDAFVTQLNEHFTVEVNTTFQRHLFRRMIQTDQETVSQYCARLRKAAGSCDFGNAAAINDRIKDQIVECCKSNELRRKLLEVGNALTLETTLQRAATFEAVELRHKEMCQESSQIHRVYQGKSASGSVP